MFDAWFLEEEPENGSKAKASLLDHTNMGRTCARSGSHRTRMLEVEGQRMGAIWSRHSERGSKCRSDGMLHRLLFVVRMWGII